VLRVEGLEAAYGESRVLFGVDLEVGAGEAVALMGRNGMGKTTLVRSVFGLLRPRGGRVAVDGRDLTGAGPHRMARAGLGLVPEGRHIFPNLSVEENLVATARGQGWTLARVMELFPRLAERRRHMGDQLSGGEQQMLAIGRALMTNPRLMVFDEATEGLAPLVREEIWAVLARIRGEGVAILVIDKNAGALARLCDRHVVIERGRVVWTGPTREFAADPGIAERWLHV